MPNKGFDIQTLLDFRPPRYFCKRCYGLLDEVVPIPVSENALRCPACKVKYTPTSSYSKWDVGRFLEDEGLEIEFDNLIMHSQELARTVRPLGRESSRPPLRILLETFLRAEKFIHFVSLGISHSFIGILKLLAQRIEISGIISNAEQSIVDEIGKYRDEAPGLDLILFKKNKGPEYWNDAPHQKLIIVDGLLAFKGSANLTVTAWRKAHNKYEIIESVTDLDEVKNLNNSYFSPIWGKVNDIDEIEMFTDQVPF